jgi:hypothetical protein
MYSEDAVTFPYRRRQWLLREPEFCGPSQPSLEGTCDGSARRALCWRLRHF